MKRALLKTAVFSIFIIYASTVSCRKTENPIKYKYGTFPDTVISLVSINSAYDDYNCDIYQLYGELYFLFSTNRESSGGQFDFEQAEVTFIFDRTNGEFKYNNMISSLPFLTKLMDAANTDGDDFGPYSLFSTVDGYEYLFTASENSGGKLDFYYFRNLPAYGNNLPNVQGPYPATLLNTSADDAYISFDAKQDSAYFSTNVSGNFDIYVKTRSEDTPIDKWLDGSYSSSELVDSINSTSEDKCPLVYKDLMLFTSNRPGGMGGYDLYYSIFRDGNWSSPVNLGPDINTSSDEYRPRLWIHNDFSNDLLIFSSNRIGGKGGFDLYFIGISFPESK
ncbi:MAG: hypothetical protein A2V64_04380 [Bacteroidetes bacterium RBG_13_43_22]|nr:MAG: hypothetical protein A2V64_04380 [Bacteroidetes bacterium RBG_13_43_22]